MSRSVPRRQHAVKSPLEEKPRRSAEGEALSALVVQIFRLNGRLMTIGDALAAPAGQSSARWQVLAAVEDEARSVAEIARVLGLARQSVQRVADVLEREGLAEYTDNPAHLRAKLLTLSARGRQALRTIGAAQAGWADRLGAQIGLTSLRRASAVLAHVLERVEDQE